jgi:hypothetical protein
LTQKLVESGQVENLVLSISKALESNRLWDETLVYKEGDEALVVDEAALGRLIAECKRKGLTALSLQLVELKNCIAAPDMVTTTLCMSNLNIHVVKKLFAIAM